MPWLKSLASCMNFLFYTMDSLAQQRTNNLTFYIQTGSSCFSQSPTLTHWSRALPSLTCITVVASELVLLLPWPHHSLVTRHPDRSFIQKYKSGHIRPLLKSLRCLPPHSECKSVLLLLRQGSQGLGSSYWTLFLLNVKM